ncbi:MULTISPECIES: helix-turn-helix domain-containing protein [Blautia]|uniref:helix-turn-helix domain-containing protein n=1 Tax=Blautia TaxID=572511 RepID=UPI000BA36562|nr:MULTISPECIES: TetR/AcrR family transcriptional regulator [Blautia]
MNERIKAIADAAAKLFLQQGYSKTQISHIAKAVGVSVGTIYLDFVGKKEILHFVLKCTIDPDFINHELQRPITDDLFTGIEQDVVKLLEESANEFEKHLKDIEDYSFEELISDTFDLMARYAVGCLFIERNQFDFKYLGEHYTAYRKRFFKAMSRYISEFQKQKMIRNLKYPELITTLIIEILSWWAMDVRYTSFETKEIPMELAKAVCMDNIISAYKL